MKLQHEWTPRKKCISFFIFYVNDSILDLKKGKKMKREKVEIERIFFDSLIHSSLAPNSRLLTLNVRIKDFNNQRKWLDKKKKYS